MQQEPFQERTWPTHLPGNISLCLPGIGGFKSTWVYLKKCPILNPAHPQCKDKFLSYHVIKLIQSQCSVWMQDELENDPKLGTVLKRQPGRSLHARKAMIPPLIMLPSSEVLSSKSKCLESFLTQSIILQVQETISILLFGRKGCNYAVQHY